MSPKISIIIPCYNHGQYLKEAIESVDRCEDKDLYEIIIMNDGSTDPDTIKILQGLIDEGYHVINQKNQGLGAARNNAIKEAKGEYILPLDSDNKIRPEYIYKSIKILDEQPDIAMVYGDAQYFGEESEVFKAGEFNLQNLMLGNFIDACAVFRKPAWERVGGYDERMPVMGYEDWDMWLNMSFNNFRFHYIPEVLYDYRLLNNSMLRSIDVEKKKQVFQYLDKKYKNFLNLNHLNETLLKVGNANKKLAFKFLLTLYFPRLGSFLVKKGIIKSMDIF
ncbi:MAG: glycosyltransferase [Ginsengibacter sp.]